MDDSVKKQEEGMNKLIAVAAFAVIFTIVGILFSLDVLFQIDHVSRIDSAKEYIMYYTPAFLKNVHVNVSDQRPIEHDGLATLPITSVSASSSLPGNEYTPDKMIDGDMRTTWQEGNTSSEGEGEYVCFEVEGKTISGIIIRSGFWMSQQIYSKNNRPKIIAVEVGGGSFKLNLSDEMKEHYVYFDKPVRATDVKMVIKETYRGYTGDCCINEVSFLGEK